ncbi:MAG: SIS domain-containing protein [Planctomycetota bacterium]|jgi:D-sedoheptulose 7-phosphate isomerase
MTPPHDDAIRAALEQARTTLDAFLADPALISAVGEFAAMCQATLEAGGKLMACGNGGSMCDAMHFAEEWTGRFQGARSALPAMAFSDPGQLSCISNDFGYEEVFARSLQAHGREGDLLVCLSTSGNSPNTVRALEEARRMGIPSVALLGKDGGQMRALADVAIVVPLAETSDRIQELHIKVLHACIEAVERAMFPGNYE